MRLDSLFLRGGYATSAGLAGSAYLLGFELTTSLGILAGSFLTTRVGVYLYFERYLAFKTFEDFRSGKLRYGCIACGASCHLKVQLDRNDHERILKYAEEKGMKETVVEKRGNKFWLKRRPSGACVFLTHVDGIPRCSIYPIRPTACRLYPLVPVGGQLLPGSLKADPMCPGFSKIRGGNFKEHLVKQDVGTYVRKFIGKI